MVQPIDMPTKIYAFIGSSSLLVGFGTLIYGIAKRDYFNVASGVGLIYAGRTITKDIGEAQQRQISLDSNKKLDEIKKTLENRLSK